LQMEKGDKGSTMIWMGVSGWMFLLVPAYPGCPGSEAIKRSLLLLLLPEISVRRDKSTCLQSVFFDGCLHHFDFVLWVQFFQYQAKRLAGKNVSKMIYFLSSGT